MPILNFNLLHVAASINQIITLYDPAPAFQFSKDVNGHYVILDGNSAIRADGSGAPAVASAGSMASFNVSPFSPNAASGVYPLPANSFAVNSPSQVYGTSVAPTDDSVYSVVQINSSIANVEPGFSRIRIDYEDALNNQYTEYFDCPFYEGWDLTAQELNQVVAYVKGGIQLVQSEIDDIRLELGYVMSRSFWRGTSVSGQIQWLPATQGLHTGPLTYTEIQPPHIIRPLLQAVLPHDMEEKSTQTWTTFLNYNYPGVTGNGNYMGAYFDAGSSISGGAKASLCVTENTDGTLTFWFYPEETESGFQTNTLQFAIEWYGPISNTINGNSASQMMITCGTQAGTSNGSPGYGSYGVGTDNGVGNGGWGVQDITEGGYDVVWPNGIGTYPAVFRWRLHPPAGSAGKAISCINSKHFISYTYGNRDNGWYNDGNLGISMTLRGATPTNPTISGVSPNTMCVGNTVTVTGTNFSSSYKMYIGSLGYPVQNLSYPNSTTATFTVPSGVPTGATNLIMTNGTYTVSKAITIAPSPTITSVYDTDSQQYDQGAPSEHITISGTNFGATQGASVLQLGSTVITPTSWSDNQIKAVIPSISAGTYTLQVAVGCATATRSFVVANRSAVSGAPTLYIDPGTITLQNQQVEQFFAYVLMTGKAPVDVTNQCTWKVNSVVGGDATDGTISNLGYYTAPNTISTSGQTSTIAATVTWNDPTDPSDPYNGTTLNSSATVTLETSSARSSPYATITVVSQLNIFLGDGRSGYVPIGARINAYPGQYIYVSFQESVDPQTGIPIASNSSAQQLTMNTVSALDPNVASVIYNLSGITVDPYNHVIKTQRTVVLGIIDPSDGNWHSMWDIGLPPAPGTDTDLASPFAIKSVPSVAYTADSLPAFTAGHEFTGSVIDYIDDLSGAQQKQLSALRKRSNTLVVGNCFYNEKTGVFEILDQLTVFSVNEEGRYKAVAVVPTQEVVIKQGQVLVITDNNLHVVKVGEKLDPLALVVGVAVDRFYTHWPILPQYMITMPDETVS